ncbi:hypothetical protein RA276_30595, partial [Pseudomonas syringae pv. tagetis]|uniref:hypothetical protein n=1 Tax=Pseudomonas syringae group genomosp. 7 TaxID=251699 RepID=UPI0037701461
VIFLLAALLDVYVYHLLSAVQGDGFMLQWRLAFDTPERLFAWAAALQHVISRHDILRTSVVWEGLESPEQVVWRNAELTVQ